MQESAKLHVDVAIIFQQEEGVEWNNPLVVVIANSVASDFSNTDLSAVVSSLIGGEAVSVHVRHLLEGLWELFGAGVIPPARGSDTTVSVDHMSRDFVEESSSVWDFRRDEAIHIVGGSWLVVFSQSDQPVDMGQASFLPFHREYEGCDSAKYVPFQEVLLQFGNLHSENSSH